jgi:creatinine amidohydrolase/Fe(II)-dependent formamide hydrolase-like protein
MRPGPWLISLLLTAGLAGPAAWAKPGNNTPATVFVAEMTWGEVAAARDQGMRTVIIPTGGIEQGGPHLVLGKHNHIVRRAAEAVARDLGDALVAPVVVYAPEGSINPPRGHMAFPGTISVPEAVFRAVLEATARSFRAHGFTEILLLGDSGGNQSGQAEAAENLNWEWAGRRTRVLHITDYYNPEANGQFNWLRQNGLAAAAEGGHADLRDTSELMAVHPDGVRGAMIPRASPGTGVRGNPRGASALLGEKLLQLKIDAALAQIRRWRAHDGKE